MTSMTMMTMIILMMMMKTTMLMKMMMLTANLSFNHYPSTDLFFKLIIHFKYESQEYL
jgi:hypothetical protein